MLKFCQSLPEDRILQGTGDIDAMLENESSRKTYTINSTGAKLTYGASLAVLAHYASSLVGPYTRPIVYTIDIS